MNPSPPDRLSTYIEVSKEHYDACIDVVDHSLTIAGVPATLRFHHTKFDANGTPKFADLAVSLADYITNYCLSARKRGAPQTLAEHARLSRIARQSLRRSEFAGESGEMLLYLLLESVLGAPQIVAKVDLKTSRKVESQGSDGIHVRWHPTDNCLDVFFGEAKLEQTASSALTRAFRSIENFHEDDMRDFEFGIVTSHFKWLDEEVRNSVISFMNRQAGRADCRVNHACLIGYNWNEYKRLNGVSASEIHAEFRKRYESDLPRLQKLIQSRFDKFKLKRLLFQVFFLPFESVQEFRDAFNKALG